MRWCASEATERNCGGDGEPKIKPGWIIQFSLQFQLEFLTVPVDKVREREGISKQKSPHKKRKRRDY